MLISTAQKQVVWLSRLYPGRIHDFTIFKELLALFDFSKLKVHVDLGFLGIVKLLPDVRIHIPLKATKNKPLTPEQKAENKKLAQLRVVVENTIAKMKSFFVLRIENRMKHKQKLNESFEICASLANFKTSFLISC